MHRNTMTKVSFATLVIMLFSAGISFAQQAITCFGGDMSGSTGSVSYSGGEVAVRYATARAITVVNVTESISEGVQQPFTERDRQSQGIESLAVNLLIYPNPTADITQLRHDFEELKQDIEDILADQNEINEDTRLQLELINQSLAELQAKNAPAPKPRRRIGFMQDKENDNQ